MLCLTPILDFSIDGVTSDGVSSYLSPMGSQYILLATSKNAELMISSKVVTAYGKVSGLWQSRRSNIAIK